MLKSLLLVACATAALLLVPLVAMQFTEEVNWTLLDFAVAGCLLFGSGIAYVLLARSATHIAGHAAACIAVARLRPRGMAYALLATALAQTLVTVIAVAGGLGAAEPPGRFGILVLNGFFVALFAASAWLYRRAARAQPRPAAA
jgi:hypothetical protein